MIIRRLIRRYATDMKFLQENGLPTAADVLYRNPESISNRLKLFHMFRLRSQLELDREMLAGIL